MRPRPFAAALAVCAALAAPSSASNAPSCPPPGSRGHSSNWGPHFDAFVEEAFGVVRDHANATPDPAKLTRGVRLIAANNTSPENRNARMIEGTPLGAVPKGTIRGVDIDAVYYTYGILELACDQPQLAFFMAHEFRHLMQGTDGKSHFDRVNDCVNDLWRKWKAGTDMTAYPDKAKAEEAFHAAKNKVISAKCVLPVEQEADAFAFELVKHLDAPWKVEAGADPSADDRVRAFKNEGLWLAALGEGQDDPGHGSADDRAKAMEAKAFLDSLARQKKAEATALQSLPRAD